MFSYTGEMQIINAVHENGKNELFVIVQGV